MRKPASASPKVRPATPVRHSERAGRERARGHPSRPAPGPRPEPGQSSMSAGTLPPFSAIFRMTCLCSHMFIVAVSFVSPV